MKETAEVVIIGAGIIGCSTAYHLSQIGITDVAILEKDQVGSGSSSKSAGMLSLQFASDELQARLALQAYARYMEFESTLNTPIDFHRTGWVTLATEESAAELRQSTHRLRALGVRTETLEPAEIKARYPEIRTDDLALATWGPDDGILDPHMIMWGYLKRARERGARLHQGVRATGIRVVAGQVRGVETDRGTIATPVVVNAAGPWAAEVGRWTGIEIPLVNSARHIVVTAPFPQIPADRPFIEDLSAGWYIRPEGPCLLMGWGKRTIDGFEAHMTPQELDQMVEHAVHRIPLLERAGIQTQWSGIRPLTADERPILGAVAGIEGLVLNCGWGGTGIIHAPAAGQLAAELIRDGQTTTFDITPLGIDRFAHPQPESQAQTEG